MENYKEYKNVRVYENMPNKDEPLYAEADVKLEGGHIWRNQFFMGSLDYSKITLVFANLTDDEKELLFNTLDKEIHNDNGTRICLARRVEELENRLYMKDKELEEAIMTYQPEPETFDCEADFIEK